MIIAKKPPLLPGEEKLSMAKYYDITFHTMDAGHDVG
jgi:hypothetical protein